jgi:RNA polymerase sigma factor (TIGR02999 family)
VLSSSRSANAQSPRTVLMTTAERGEITRLLLEWRPDVADPAAEERLLALVYPELRRLAASLMQRERPGHTLAPTALVHEAYLKLVDGARTEWRDRAHFLGVAARAMRQVLVDHARAKGAAKRGGGWRRVTFDESAEPGVPGETGILEVDDALTRLAEADPRGARGAELHLFGGLTTAEIALVLGVSPRTVESDWAMARLWLARELRPEGA